MAWLRVTAATSVLALAAPAGALVLPGIPPCPTMFMPPPCLVMDFGKIGRMVTQVKQEADKVRQITASVQKFQSAGQSLGNSLTGAVAAAKSLPQVSLTGFLQPIKGLESQVNSMVTNLPSAIELASTQLVVDATGKRPAGQSALVRATNSAAWAAAVATKSTEPDTARRMVSDLTGDAGAAKSLRDDFAVNSRVRLELLRQRLVGDTLLATLAQARAAHAAMKVRNPKPMQKWTQSTAVVSSVIGVASEVFPKVAELERLAGAATRIAASAALVDQIRDAQAGLVAVGQFSLEANQSKLQAAQNLLNVATAIGSRNVSRGTAIASAITSRLSAVSSLYQTAMSGGEASALSMAKLRGLSALDLRLGVNPTTIIGTWGDPMKDEDARAVVQRLASSGALGKLSAKQLESLKVAAVIMLSASLYDEYAADAAMDARQTWQSLEQTASRLEDSRGVDLDGSAWQTAIDRIDAAAVPIEVSLRNMPESASTARADEVAAATRAINTAAQAQ